MRTKVQIIIPVILVSCTLITSIVLSSTIIKADSSGASVSVGIACTMSGGGTYSDNVSPGNYKEISGSTISTVCNDSGGYALYAIGYSGDSYDTSTNTKMLGANNIGNISTGTSGSNSYWAMKVNPTTGNAPTITNSFSSYHVIPETYTEVAEYASSTASPSATGASVDATYKVNISTTQIAGTYTGKVKYTMVHPTTAPAPEIPQPDASCNTPVPGVSYMQNINSSNKAAVLASLTEGNTYYLRDNRDEEPYCVSKLADGKLWMIDNLRLDPIATDLNTLVGNTNASSTSLNYFKNGSGTDQYTRTAVRNKTTEFYDYITADVNIEYKNEGTPKTGVYYNYCAATAGSYCYADQEGVGDATEDICPTNWSLPTGGSSGDFQALYLAYSSDDSAFNNAFKFIPRGDYWNNSRRAYGLASYHWSSTQSDGALMFNLNISGSGVDTIDYSGRWTGFPIRCKLK